MILGGAKTVGKSHSQKNLLHFKGMVHLSGNKPLCEPNFRACSFDLTPYSRFKSQSKSYFALALGFLCLGLSSNSEADNVEKVEADKERRRVISGGGEEM